jgi:hypothetical protein
VTNYLLDHAWAGERERLDGLGVVFDPGTIGHLERVGVGPGWRCLEVGGGSGTVARWLCERTGPTGRVVATDLDTGILTSLGIPGLEIRRHDIVQDDLEEGAFDLVHTRLVLEHLPQRDVALTRMARALAPGGWLVVESFQLTPMTVASARPSAGLRWASLSLPALFRAVLLAMRPAGLDSRLGHRLPAELSRLGLVDVDAEGRAVFIQGGSPAASVATLSLTRFADLLTDPPAALTAPGPWTLSGLLHRLPPLRRFLAGRLDGLRSLFDDPDIWAMGPVLVAARGRRPSG